jgi:hypothetical protein
MDRSSSAIDGGSWAAITPNPISANLWLASRSMRRRRASSFWRGGLIRFTLKHIASGQTRGSGGGRVRFTFLLCDG